MEFKHLEVGQYVIINKPESPYDGMEGKVLSTTSDIAGTEQIRLELEETAEIVGGFKASELS